MLPLGYVPPKNTTEGCKEGDEDCKKEEGDGDKKPKEESLTLIFKDDAKKEVKKEGGDKKEKKKKGPKPLEANTWPTCDGGSGVLGVDCVSSLGYPRKLTFPLGYVPPKNSTKDGDKEDKPKEESLS